MLLGLFKGNLLHWLIRLLWLNITSIAEKNCELDFWEIEYFSICLLIEKDFHWTRILNQ